MQAIVHLKEIEKSIKKSVSHLLQNLVEVLRETKGKRKMYVCASLGKFTFYGETFFDNPTMKKIRLELRASTDKHKVSFPKTLLVGHFTRITITSTAKAHRKHSSNSSDRKGDSNGK